MTFNVQALPLVVAVAGGQSDDSGERARRVADAILSLPAGTEPDVIAFNEVFNDDAREELLSRLSGWSNRVEKMVDDQFAWNAGLMLFSRYTFLPLRTGGPLYERYYSSSADTDALASKGVGIVQIETPTRPTTIAFTHMQASYASEDEYSEVRRDQFDAINEALTDLFAGDDSLFSNVILLGDLNVRGDPAATSGEWGSVFENSSTPLFDHLLDGWRQYMHPPATNLQPDPGLTNINFENPAQRQRLDYMCFGRPDRADFALVPQHMFTRLRSQSDHFSLEAVVQRFSENCTPSEAIEFLALTPTSTGPGQPSTLRQRELTFAFDGSYQWLFVGEPGTYTVFASPDVLFDLYFQSNLTDRIYRIDVTVLEQLPDALVAGLRDSTMDPRGSTFVCREPFFVAARHRTAEPGTGSIVLVEHRGETPGLAIGLELHTTISSGFPSGQKLGTDDVCWFRATMPRTISGVARPETFTIQNPTNGTVTARLRDAAQVETDSPTSGGHGEFEVVKTATGDEFVYLTLERSSVKHSGFTVTWTSPVSYLDLNKPFFLFVNDESGVDSPGADEPELRIWLDTIEIFNGTWDDADTGERWPGLAEAVRARIALLMPAVSKVGFTKELLVSCIEPDTGIAHGSQVWVIAPLSPSELDTVDRVTNMPIVDPVKDGRYSLWCTLTRFP
ncbi:endonuclease/exonuclease/phosphatase family protein [Nocardia noduli]|uniref:endonuclease/exonuclease/phosphatase family protein n=1 Tax=Nocardia noduli TaxID=2815722 RepID=UPI001C244E6A|nr:endonuclease/exonuclease/phosphatase family protein [Nocardia noduli]